MSLVPTEPWQPAPRMAQTLTSPSSCCPTRRRPPRGEPAPRRGTSTRSSTRGETQWVMALTEVPGRWFTASSVCLSVSAGSTLSSPWRSPFRGGWICLWRTASPSWAERGSSLARCVCVMRHVGNALCSCQTHKFLSAGVLITTRQQRQKNEKNHLLLLLFRLSCSWIWTKLTSRPASHNGNDVLNSFWTMLKWN